MKNPTFLKIILLVLFSFIYILSCSKGTEPSSDPPMIKVRKVEVMKNIEWARPDDFGLRMDIHYPNYSYKDNLFPVLVIIHGGGWLVGDKLDMTCMAEYIVENSDYVICNINYRLLKDNNNTTKMNEMVEDVFGAILWIKEHVSSYNGDPSKVIVTGDSAGGHLAAMVVLGAKKLETDGFEGPTLGFNPTYLPQGKTAEQIANENGLAVQGAIFNYTAFHIYDFCLDNMETDGNVFWEFAGVEPRGLFGDDINIQDNPDYYKAVTPSYFIPNVQDMQLPPLLCTIGTEDGVVSPASVKSFISELNKQGQDSEYWEHEGRSHGFLACSGWDRYTHILSDFDADAIPAINMMIAFMDKICAQ